MKFIIEIKEGWHKRYYNVRRVALTKNLETFRIWNDSKDFELQSNRPLLRGKGLKFKTPIWKRVSGTELLASEFDRFVAAIMKVVD